MAHSPTSTVLGVTIRVAGVVPTDVGISHAGTPEAEVRVTIGDVLCYLCDRSTLTHIRCGWDQAAVAARRLREQVSTTWVGAEPGTYPVGVIVRLVGEPRITLHTVPARPTIHAPEHLRVQVGPLVWQVLDRAAYESITACWRTAERLHI